MVHRTSSDRGVDRISVIRAANPQEASVEPADGHAHRPARDESRLKPYRLACRMGRPPGHVDLSTDQEMGSGPDRPNRSQDDACPCFSAGLRACRRCRASMMIDALSGTEKREAFRTR